MRVVPLTLIALTAVVVCVQSACSGGPGTSYTYTYTK